MDKYEYRVRAEEINALIDQGKYADAVKIANSIDWRRVKSVMMLCKISELYKMNRRYEESKEILLLAYERHPGARKIVYFISGYFPDFSNRILLNVANCARVRTSPRIFADNPISSKASSTFSLPTP